MIISFLLIIFTQFLSESETGGIKKELNEWKSRGVVDKLHPVGSIFATAHNIDPPMQGVNGVRWELLPEGYVLMTSDKNNIGKRSGAQRLDSGSTNGHALSIAEMPSHNHGYSEPYYNQAVEGGSWSRLFMRQGTTSSTGGNRPHAHRLNILNQKIMVWKRIA